MVERWIPNPKHPAGGFRKDWAGFADILAFRPDDDISLLIQSCGSDYAEHNRKILDNPIAPQWVKSANRRLILMGWRKIKKKRGGKAMVWAPRIKEFTLFDFIGGTNEAITRQDQREPGQDYIRV